MSPSTETADERLLQAYRALAEGRPNDAENAFRQILAEGGPAAGPLAGLAEVAATIGKADMALTLTERAASAADATWLERAIAGERRQNAGDAAAAVVWYEAALIDRPFDAGLHNNLARCLGRTKRQPLERRHLRAAVVLEPSWPGPLSNLATAEIGDVARAERLHRWATRLAPRDPTVLTDAAGVMMNLANAKRLLKRALVIQPATRDAWVNLANILTSDGDVAGAIRALDRAGRIDPRDRRIDLNRAMLNLGLGRIKEGFAGYEVRIQLEEEPRADDGLPLWRPGEPVTGRHLLLTGEQGFGDVLQFIRFVPALHRLGARATVRCPAALHNLLRPVQGVIGVIDADAPAPPDVDGTVPLLGLPLRLGIDIDDLAVDLPCLTADPGLRQFWRGRLPPGPKIGLVWAGNPAFSADRLRSPRLAPLLPLFDIPGSCWVLLQQGDGRRDLQGLTLPPNVTDMGPIDSFDDTAAILAELDLTISSCTSVAHLAGALGRPLWMLLARDADWRWMRDRCDSPWYPSARLFRQPARGDWAAVVDAVAAGLRQSAYLA